MAVLPRVLCCYKCPGGPREGGERKTVVCAPDGNLPGGAGMGQGINLKATQEVLTILPSG